MSEGLSPIITAQAESASYSFIAPQPHAGIGFVVELFRQSRQGRWRLFGDQVRAARGRRGLTQVQLADAVGVSEQWIRKIEAGESSPSFDTIEALARALQIPVGDLFEAGKISADAESMTVAAAPLKPDEVEWLLAGARLLARPRPG